MPPPDATGSQSQQQQQQQRAAARELHRVEAALSEHWDVHWSHLDLHEQLGQGGCGAVYRATWMGAEVAVKEVVNATEHSDILQALIKEAAILSTLHHPHVATFLGLHTQACAAPRFRWTSGTFYF